MVCAIYEHAALLSMNVIPEFMALFLLPRQLTRQQANTGNETLYLALYRSQSLLRSVAHPRKRREQVGGGLVGNRIN